MLEIVRVGLLGGLHDHVTPTEERAGTARCQLRRAEDVTIDGRAGDPSGSSLPSRRRAVRRSASTVVIGADRLAVAAYLPSPRTHGRSRHPRPGRAARLDSRCRLADLDVLAHRSRELPASDQHARCRCVVDRIGEPGHDHRSEWRRAVAGEHLETRRIHLEHERRQMTTIAMHHPVQPAEHVPRPVAERERRPATSVNVRRHPRQGRARRARRGGLTWETHTPQSTTPNPSAPIRNWVSDDGSGVWTCACQGTGSGNEQRTVQRDVPRLRPDLETGEDGEHACTRCGRQYSVVFGFLVATDTDDAGPSELEGEPSPT